MVRYSILTENCHYHHARLALRDFEGVDHVASVKGVGVAEDATKALDDLNINSATANQTAMDQYKSNIEAYKSEQPADWKRKLEEQNEAAKAKVTKAMDDALQVAVAIIDKLPPAQQQAAANVYERGVEYVMQVFNTLVIKLKEMLNYIVDFIKGVWNALVAAKDAVVGAVTQAIDWIRGIFSFTSDVSDRVSTGMNCMVVEF